MGEEKTILTFSFLEVATALVRTQGLHDGLWGFYVEFGLGAANIPAPEDITSFNPAAIIPVRKVGLQKFSEPVKGLTVDAAVVNPAVSKAQGVRQIELE